MKKPQQFICAGCQCLVIGNERSWVRIKRQWYCCQYCFDHQKKVYPAQVYAPASTEG